MTTTQFQQAVEAYMDAQPLNVVVTNTLSEVAEVCSLKAEHLRSNWQDENSALLWENAAFSINELAGQLDSP